MVPAWLVSLTSNGARATFYRRDRVTFSAAGSCLCAAYNKQNRAPPGEDQMAITAPQGLSRDAAGIAAATRVRWTYIAPTLLAYWIMSMFDKSNISIVIANPKFLDEMQ